jgi:hypothetical protein
MSESARRNDEQPVNDGSQTGRVEVIRVRRADALFSTFVYIENPSRPCRVAFTRTHFAWRPLKTIFFLPFTAAGVYSGVAWSAINLVEFGYRHEDHEKMVRVSWTAGPDQSSSIEMTRIMQFRDWIKPFRDVGFFAPADNPFRVTTLRGFLSDYGPVIWILLLAVCSFILSQFWLQALFVIPVIALLVGVPLWIWATWKVRAWFPPGTSIALHREARRLGEPAREIGKSQTPSTGEPGQSPDS